MARLVLEGLCSMSEEQHGEVEVFRTLIGLLLAHPPNILRHQDRRRANYSLVPLQLGFDAGYPYFEATKILRELAIIHSRSLHHLAESVFAAHNPFALHLAV